MDRQKIAHALSILAESKSFVTRVRQIEEIVAGWEETPLLFGGALEPLNSLVDVGLQNKEALGKLIELAHNKRRLIPATKRVDYQRELMREKRARLARAVKLEEMVRGTSLVGDKRVKYKAALQQRWMHERNAFIAKKGDLSWKERNDAANEFWAKVDAQLDKDLAEAQHVLEHPPVKRKRVVELKKPVTALSKAFDRAKR